MTDDAGCDKRQINGTPAGPAAGLDALFIVTGPAMGMVKICPVLSPSHSSVIPFCLFKLGQGL